MSQEQKKFSSRKKFLVWTAAMATSVGILKIFQRRGTEKTVATTPTVKMLTQDGKLVEIDQSLIAASGKKVTNQELQHWIKK